MFVASILAFTTGIYLGTVRSCPAAFTGIGLCILFIALPFFLRYNLRRLYIATLVIAFFLAGVFRVSLIITHDPPPPGKDPAVYSGTVVESSRTTKVIELAKPESLDGIKAYIRSDRPAWIGDSVTAVGVLRPLTLNFKNPDQISWKWIKKQEGTAYEIRGNIISVHEGSGIIERMRRYCARKIDASQAAGSEIIKALTIGDTTGVDDATKDLFLKTGTSHILSISGSHLAIIVAFIFFIITFLLRVNSRLGQKGADRKYAALISIPFAIAFMLISGSSLPTIRATMMIVIYMIAIIFERTRHVQNGFFLSVLAVLTIYPFSLFSPSFQLTFISVLFIILFNKACGRRLLQMPRIRRCFLSMVMVTVAATAGTLPVVLYHFHGFNPLSVIHNLISVPLLCMVATPLALTGIIMPWGDHILRLTGNVIGLTMDILRHMNRGYIYPIVRPSLAEATIYLIVAVSLFNMKKKIIRFAFWFLILPVALFAAGTSLYNRFDNSDLCINYIDVGLGDAMLIEAPHGVRLLVDGGGFYGSDFDIGRSVIGPFLLAKKIATLDYVINTHPHEDHLGGLKHVARYFAVQSFMTGWPGLMYSSHNTLQKLLHARDIPLSRMKNGEILRIGADTKIEVLNASGPDEDINNSSLVLRVNHGGTSFLLTGDIGEEVERSLIMRGASLKSSVLKIPHHGSRYSSSPGFIRAVRPDIAVLSVGPGIKGIPSPEALARYELLHIPVYRTDHHGCIRICTDGKRITVQTQNP